MEKLTLHDLVAVLENEIVEEYKEAANASDEQERWRSEHYAEAFEKAAMIANSFLIVNEGRGSIREIGHAAAKSNTHRYGKSDKSGVWVAVVAV